MITFEEFTVDTPAEDNTNFLVTCGISNQYAPDLTAAMKIAVGYELLSPHLHTVLQVRSFELLKEKRILHDGRGALVPAT